MIKFETIFIFVGLLFLSSCSIISKKNIIHGKYWTFNSDEIMTLNGPLNVESSKEFFAMMSPKVNTLVLTSTGGDVESGLQIGQHIYQNKINIIVKGYCASSCANYLFVAGYTKTVIQNSWVGWHGAVTPMLKELPEMFKKAGLDNKQIALHMKKFLKFSKDELMFYRQLGINSKLLSDSHIMGENKKIIKQMEEGQYKAYMWCPNRSVLESYGLKGIKEFWYPKTKQNLIKLGLDKKVLLIESLPIDI